MKIVTEIKEWQFLRKKINSQTIGFIPTMGNLHAGHLSLCERSQQENALTVVSIFINPTQFNQAQDFQSYPRTLEQDKQLLADKKIDYVLIPNAAAMYPENFEIQVDETLLSQKLEGECRPGHFKGMLSVVTKLLCLVQADAAYFGEKDFQQLLLIKKMVAALFIPTKIIACETIRTAEGLALSSRNSRLNQQQKEKAIQFANILANKHYSLAEVKQKLTALNISIDYIAEEWQRRLGAVWIDDVRLIDNIPI